MIPRGGEGLKDALKAVATVPVMYAAAGNCHVYVHADADLEMARGSPQREGPAAGVCNSAETLLVNAEVAGEFLPGVAAELAGAGVELVGDGRARAAAGATPVGAATDADWDTEYLGMKMAVGVVDSLADAIDHVNPHGTGHSEAIVTGSDAAADGFTEEVDAAVVYVNASTRFTDGFEFGMGAEIGNSTQKLHARGPIGLRELTTFKYVVHGDGQVRGVAAGRGRRDRRSRGRVQPAAHRAPGARPGGGFPARARPGAAGAVRRGAAQADRSRAGPRGAARDDAAGGGDRSGCSRPRTSRRAARGRRSPSVRWSC